MSDIQIVCPECGSPMNKETTAALWDIYDRISDGRSTWEPLVFTSEEFEDSWDTFHEENFAIIAMERNMHERGLCTNCGRPDLRGVTEDMIMTEEEAKDMHEMWSEMAAERRMGA
jgi:hypothetical protein